MVTVTQIAVANMLLQILNVPFSIQITYIYQNFANIILLNGVYRAPQLKKGQIFKRCLIKNRDKM